MLQGTQQTAIKTPPSEAVNSLKDSSDIAVSRCPLKKGGSIFQTKRLRGFQKGNTLWDNPNSKKNWFPKGKITKPWLGKNLSQSHKDNISKTARKRGIGKWMKGKHNSLKTEFKKGILPQKRFEEGRIPWNKKEHIKLKCQVCNKEYFVIPSRKYKSKFCSKVCSDKIPKYFGQNHWAWKGGITPINIKIRRSQKYGLWRKRVFERDEYVCIWCGYKGNELHADHIKPFAIFPSLRFVVNNGRTLCKACHKKTKTYLKGRNKKCCIVKAS